MDTQYTLAQLLANGYKTMLIVIDDLEVFESLDLEAKRKVSKLIRSVQPMPEVKEDHKWIMDWMKETIQADEADQKAGIVKVPMNVSIVGAEVESALAPIAEIPVAVVKEVKPVSERNVQILALRAEGKTLKEIAIVVGLSGPRVSGILRSLKGE